MRDQLRAKRAINFAEIRTDGCFDQLVTDSVNHAGGAVRIETVAGC